MKIFVAILLLVAIAECRHSFHNDRRFDIEELEDYLNAARREHKLRDAFKKRRSHHFEDFEEEEDDNDDDEDEEDKDLENFESMRHSKKDHVSKDTTPTPETKKSSPETTTEPATTAATTTTTSKKPKPTETTSPTTATKKPSSKLHELLKHFAESIRSLRYNEAINRKTMMRLFREIMALKMKVKRLENQNPKSALESILHRLLGHGNHGHRGGMGGMGGKGEEPFGGDLNYAQMFVKDEEDEDEQPRRHHRFH